MTVAPALRVVAELLDASGIPYMVVGSFASSYHGELRSRQIDDVRRVIAMQPSALDVAYIAKWVAELDLAAQWNAATVVRTGSP